MKRLLVFLLCAPLFASTASYVKTDITTLGAWPGVYGSDGHNVIGDSGEPSYPGYATVSVSGNSSASIGSAASPQLEKASNHAAFNRGVWFSSTNFTIDIALSSASQIAFYFYDSDSSGRTVKVEVLDVNAGNAVLDTRHVPVFTAIPRYLIWSVSGHVAFKFTNDGGANCIVNGFFFDPSGTTATVTPTASFFQSDNSTGGNWVGHPYGADGGFVSQDTGTAPSYLLANVKTGNSTFTYQDPSTDPQAPFKWSNHAVRIGAFLYATGTWQWYLGLTNASAKQLTTYSYNVDAGGAGQRDTTITIIDTTSGGTLATHATGVLNTVGVYLSFNIFGPLLTVQVSPTPALSNQGIVNALLFDPGVSTAVVHHRVNTE